MRNSSDVTGPDFIGSAGRPRAEDRRPQTSGGSRSLASASYPPLSVSGRTVRRSQPPQRTTSLNQALLRHPTFPAPQQLQTRPGTGVSIAVQCPRVGGWGHLRVVGLESFSSPIEAGSWPIAGRSEETAGGVESQQTDQSAGDRRFAIELDPPDSTTAWSESRRCRSCAAWVRLDRDRRSFSKPGSVEQIDASPWSTTTRYRSRTSVKWNMSIVHQAVREDRDVEPAVRPPHQEHDIALFGGWIWRIHSPAHRPSPSRIGRRASHASVGK